MVAEVLNISEFDEAIMDSQLTRISVIDAEVTFHFKDGHTEVRMYTIPKKRGFIHSEEQKRNQSIYMKKWWKEKNRGN